MTAPNTPDSFWARVAKAGSDECWPWTASSGDGRYGQVRYQGRVRQAHRVAFFLTHGRWAQPCTLHMCDTPLCCNPAHLYEGDWQRNMDDKVARGRARGNTTRGENRRGNRAGRPRRASV